MILTVPESKRIAKSAKALCGRCHVGFLAESGQWAELDVSQSGQVILRSWISAGGESRDCETYASLGDMVRLYEEAED